MSYKDIQEGVRFDLDLCDYRATMKDYLKHIFMDTHKHHRNNKGKFLTVIILLIQKDLCAHSKLTLSVLDK